MFDQLLFEYVDGITTEAARHRLETNCRREFPRLFDATALKPAGSLPAVVMTNFRNIHSNPAYEPITRIRANCRKDFEFAAIDKAEENFVLALLDTMKTPPGKAREQELRNLNDIRSQLAEFYVEICKHYAPASWQDERFEMGRKIMEDLLCGTLSAYAFNTLKSEGLIPEDTKPEKLYARPSNMGLAR